MGVVLREMEARPPIGTDRKEIITQYLKEAYQSLKIQLPNQRPRTNLSRDYG